MQTQKRSYALPQTIVEKQREEALERDIIEGCRDMADVYLEIQREFDPLDTEVTRACNPC